MKDHERTVVASSWQLYLTHPLLAPSEAQRPRGASPRFKTLKEAWHQVPRRPLHGRSQLMDLRENPWRLSNAGSSKEVQICM